MTPEATLAGLERLRKRYVRIARNRVATGRWRRSQAEEEYRALCSAIRIVGACREWLNEERAA